MVDLSHDTEKPSSFWASLQNLLFQAGQLIDLRLALLMGLLAFFVAVGFDSSGNQAEAADLLRQSPVAPAPAVTIVEKAAFRPNERPTTQSGGRETTTLETARRLRHGSLTSAVMTSNRLTQAHFFTDLPSSR
jgi:hypothetical protein